jgi:cytochrome c oxidase assembly protein subunit 11
VSTAENTARKNKRLAAFAGGIALTMLGLAYAAVPLYSLFCQATGFGGTTQRAASATAPAADKFVSVRFDANVAKDLGWSFSSGQPPMRVRIGEPVMAHFVAVNNAKALSTGTAVFNVTPAEAGIYFNKIECFCFTEQPLQPGQRAELPVQFFVDPAILQDPDTSSIREITLSYTFYPATKKTANDQAALSTN